MAGAGPGRRARRCPWCQRASARPGAGAGARLGVPSPRPTLRQAASPLVVGGEDAAAGRVVAILGLPGARGATLVLTVGGSGRHGEAEEGSVVGRRGPRRCALQRPLCAGARQRAEVSIPAAARAEVLKGTGAQSRGACPPKLGPAPTACKSLPRVGTVPAPRGCTSKSEVGAGS